MNDDDIIEVLATVAAIDRRTVGESDVWLWREIIGHLPKDLAVKAVIDHARECPGVWLEPGHVHARVRAIQRDRRDRMSLKELRAEQDRYDERLAPKILELADAMSADVPIKYHRLSADPAKQLLLSVPCPWPPCKAGVGVRCKLRSGKTHDARYRAVLHLPTAAPPSLPDRLLTADARCSNCAKDLHAERDDVSRGLCTKCADTIDGPRPQPNSGRGSA